jgi:acyl-[acyl-carrier-protein]-phospholipid O-acyltransferase/long-chain-fatty-acid--[acyl-carrier-protein] ligase
MFSRRFLPLFCLQFLGAASDNLFKNAVALLLIFRPDVAGGLSPQVAVSLGAGLFILPFFLLSAWGGLLADRLRKDRLIRRIKAAELAISLLSAWALAAGWLPGLLGCLLLLGAKSACFGPVKYAVLPELLEPERLVTGNALVEGGTFLAILAGTIAGGLLVLRDGGALAVGLLLVLLAGLGLLAAQFLPATHEEPSPPALSFHLYRLGRQSLSILAGRKGLLTTALGISWFWFLGATFLAQFPALARDVLGGAEQLVTTMLVMFTIGVALGAALGGKLLKRLGARRLTILAAVGMGLLCCHLWSVTSRPWALADLLGIAVCGGCYVLPLYTRLQRESEEASRARLIGANNILNALFMTVSALLSAVWLAMGGSVPGIVLGLGLASLGLAAGLVYRKSDVRK